MLPRGRIPIFYHERYPPELHLFLLSTPSMPAPQEFIKYIDDKADAFIQRLSDAVAIPR